jgi:glycerol-3-phosphate acyltransferase PlsX
MIRVAIDAMGGDVGPEVTVPAALAAISRHSELHLTLVGNETVVRRLLEEQGGAGGLRCEVIHAPDKVEMADRPSVALRTKRESSMRVALDLVRDGKADACVSAGNTGALMAIARYVLKTLPGIDRPAICATMPSVKGTTLVLDLGANVDSSSEELFRFAVMGSVLASAIDSRTNPKIALLNIGEEEIKGNDRVKQTAVLLEQSALNYCGFAEGNDIYSGKFDVIVCDGFVGNVCLKMLEGVSETVIELARYAYKEKLLWRAGLAMLSSGIERIKEVTDWEQYGGAPILGFDRLFIKAHGRSKARAISNAGKVAARAVSHDLANAIQAMLPKA